MKNYANIVGSLVFAIVAVLHLMRVFFPVSIVIGDWNVPMWVSIILFIVAGTLSAWLLRSSNHSKPE